MLFRSWGRDGSGLLAGPVWELSWRKILVMPAHIPLSAHLCEVGTHQAIAFPQRALKPAIWWLLKRVDPLPGLLSLKNLSPSNKEYSFLFCLSVSLF